MRTKSSHELDFLQAVLQNAGALLLVLDHQGRITCFNRACEQLSGYSFAEVEGKFPWDTLLPPEQADTVRQQAFEAPANNPQAMAGHYSNEWLSKDGERYLIEWSNTLLRGADGKLEYMVCVGTEMTQRMKFEHELEMQATIIDQIHDAVVATDLEGNVTSWNKGAERILGYTAEEMLGSPIALVYPPDQQTFLIDQVITPLRTKGTHVSEVVMQHKNGTLLHGHLSLSMRHDRNRKPIGMIGYTTDITEQKQADATARSATALLHSVIENIPSMIFVKRADDLSFTMFNRAGEELLGFDRADLIGKNDHDLFPPQQADFFTSRDRQVLHQKGYEDIAEEPIDTRLHGRRILRTQKIALKDAQGKPEFLLGISEDITERKAAEDALRANNQITSAVLDTAPVLIAYLDPDLNFVRVNRAYAAADRKDPEYFLGKNHFALYPHTENEAIFRRVLESGEPHASQAKPFEYTHNPERGTTHWDWTLTPIKDGNGKVSGLVLSLTNVTDRIVALEAAERSELALMALTESLEARITERTRDLSLAKDSAERANRAKSEFLSRMSHELRTPMNAILGFAQVLELESIAPEYKDYIQEIHRAGDHLLELINELLDLSRIETGKLAVLVQPTTLQTILSQALQITQAMREERQIVLLNYCQSEARVLADATRLRQILVNLLSNAVKYNRAGGRITVACQPQSDTTLRIAVADTGPGIAPEKQHLLFRPFERLGAELSGVEGVGIGLALSKQLAELMDAKIGVDSTPGVGSTFWLELALAPLSTPLTSSAPNTSQPPAKEQKHKCNVLYVEDNAANLKLVEVLLRRQPDIDLISASNGEHGLELARRYRPDAILLDIHLPGMDGYALLEKLQADAATSAIPVLAVSADAMPVDVARGLQAGFKRYLTKPIDGKALIAAIREVV